MQVSLILLPFLLLIYTDTLQIVPKRVLDFVKKVKTMTLLRQPKALICSICGNASPEGPRLSNCLHMYCEVCWKSTVKSSGKTKGMEQPCKSEGCKGYLGKAVLVPENMGIANMGSEIWTGQKAKSGLALAAVDH